MLNITVPAQELWDEKNEKFVELGEVNLQLEHSLISLAKWESRWHKPFLAKGEKTVDETIDYIRCMTVSPQKVDDAVFQRLSSNEIKKVMEYIEDSMTATWFSEKTVKGRKKSREVVTAEIIYYWMIALQIPFECQKWHLNRLLTLIRVCNEKNEEQNSKGKKRRIGRQELADRARLNAERRKALHSSG